MDAEHAGTLFAYITQADEIAGLYVGQGWLPLVFTDESKHEPMRLLAQVVANDTGEPIHLVRFRATDVAETVSPTKT